MNTIKKIDGELKGAYALKDEYEKILKNSPNNFAIKLSLKSINCHINQLHSSLREEKLTREKEVIFLKLIGGIAKFGSIPLTALSKISDNFSNSIYFTAAFIRHHDNFKERDLKEIITSLDLRLAGLYSGSTKLLITGELNPDLFGNSILESSLEKTFNLLNSENSESFITAVSNIGVKSSERLKELLKNLKNEKLEMDLSWHSPDGREYKWNGTNENIITIANTLQNIEISEPTIFKIEAELVTLSLKGNFEIRDTQNNYYRGKFILDILNNIKQHHIGDFVNCSIERKIIKNRATNQTKNIYRLLNIEDII